MASKQNNTKNKKPTNLVENLKEISVSLNIFYCLINVQLDWKQVIST